MHDILNFFLNNFYPAIIASIMAAILVSLFIGIIHKKNKEIEQLKDYKSTQNNPPTNIAIESNQELIAMFEKQGLKLFLPRRDFFKKDIFNDIINVNQNGQILIAGRTVNWLMKYKKDKVIEGLKKGINFKILILDLGKLENEKINITPLQLEKKENIYHDLEESIKAVKEILKIANTSNFIGSFELKICDYIIFNSMTSFIRDDSIEVIFDFSFGTDEIDKYNLHLKSNIADQHSFTNKLYNFYNGLFKQSTLYAKYESGKIIFRDDIKNLIRSNINHLIDEHSDSEILRKNNVQNYLSKLPLIFTSIDKSTNDRSTINPLPISVQLEITNSCETACKHCKRHTWKRYVNQDDEMKPELIISLLEDLCKNDVQSVTISGGEPTKKAGFDQILTKAKFDRKKMKVGILSNGISIDRSLAEIIVNNSDWIRISIDASNKKLYRDIRGIDRFDDVCKSINILNEINSKYGNKCKIGIGYTIQKLNIDDVFNMFDLLNQLNITDKKNILVFKFVHGNNGFLCDKSQLDTFSQKLDEYLKKDEYQISNLLFIKNFLEKYSNLSDIENGIPMNSFYRNKPMRCFTPYIHSLIDAFGKVYPCCFLYYDNEDYENYTNNRFDFEIDILSEQLKFSSIWNNDKYYNFRKKLESIDVNRFEKCKECTRHFIHNAFISSLYNNYNNNCTEEKKLFLEVLKEYPGDTVWF